MFRKLSNKIKREEGQGLVEYALILVLVSVVVIVILAQMGPAVGNIFSGVVTALNGGGTGDLAAAVNDAEEEGPGCLYDTNVYWGFPGNATVVYQPNIYRYTTSDCSGTATQDPNMSGLYSAIAYTPAQAEAECKTLLGNPPNVNLQSFGDVHFCSA